MSTYSAIIDNGKTSAEGFYKAISMLLGNQGVPSIYQPTSLQVVQHAAGANMSVDISIGSALLPNSLGTFGYNGWQDAPSNLAIGTASALNPRIDAVVAYINMSAVSSTNSNNPGSLAFMDVQGTPASSPVAPNSSAIQAALGAGVPWIWLAQVTVPQNATQIVTAYIADARPPFATYARIWGGSSNTSGHVVPNVADDTVMLNNATATVKNKTFDSSNTFATPTTDANGWTIYTFGSFVLYARAWGWSVASWASGAEYELVTGAALPVGMSNLGGTFVQCTITNTANVSSVYGTIQMPAAQSSTTALNVYATQRIGSTLTSMGGSVQIWILTI